MVKFNDVVPILDVPVLFHFRCLTNNKLCKWMQRTGPICLGLYNIHFSRFQAKLTKTIC